MSKQRILVVDDEPANLAVLRAILGDHYELVFARSGAEALLGVHRHQPQLVLLDVEMGDMDGYEVCRRLKAEPATAHIPVIFITALAESGAEAAGFAAGGVDYVVKPVCAPTVLARVRTHLSLVQTSQLEESYQAAIRMLAVAGEYRDTDIGSHIWRMAAYSRVLAEAAGWPGEWAQLLEQAAPMHDVGKIGIPDHILKKPGKLDPAEWVVMKTHCTIGHEILARYNVPLFNLAAEVALGHHERWDGSGYPQGLAGDHIPESARIVAIGDVFDALSMKRPYKEPWPLERTVQTIVDSAGSHFDPALVEVFRAELPHLVEVKAHWDTRERDQPLDDTSRPSIARATSSVVGAR